MTLNCTYILHHCQLPGLDIVQEFCKMQPLGETMKRIGALELSMLALQLRVNLKVFFFNG